MSHTTVHLESQVGFAKNTEQYNQVRSGYTPEALALLHKAMTASASINVVEIGAGTGIFTRALLEHPDWVGAIGALRAVEPNAGMQETFKKHTTDPRVVLVDGTFEDTGAESGSADLIAIATAFHWCLDIPAAAAEFIRVLKPNGVLCLIWTGQDSDATPWLTQVVARAEAYEDPEAGSPNGRTETWRALFSLPAYTATFAPPEEEVFRWATPVTEDGLVRRALTASRVAPLSDAEKDVFVRDVKAIMGRGEGKVWIDKEAGTFELPQMCRIVISNGN